MTNRTALLLRLGHHDQVQRCSHPDASRSDFWGPAGCATRRLSCASRFVRFVAGRPLFNPIAILSAAAQVGNPPKVPSSSKVHVVMRPCDTWFRFCVCDMFDSIRCSQSKWDDTLRLWLQPRTPARGRMRPSTASSDQRMTGPADVYILTIRCPSRQVVR